eukprot:COSAG01_NODE_616_length_14815_cov_8.518076_22_plen_55_part_00
MANAGTDLARVMLFVLRYVARGEQGDDPSGQCALSCGVGKVLPPGARSFEWDRG